MQLHNKVLKPPIHPKSASSSAAAVPAKWPSSPAPSGSPQEPEEASASCPLEAGIRSHRLCRWSSPPALRGTGTGTVPGRPAARGTWGSPALRRRCRWRFRRRSCMSHPGIGRWIGGRSGRWRQGWSFGGPGRGREGLPGLRPSPWWQEWTLPTRKIRKKHVSSQLFK